MTRRIRIVTLFVSIVAAGGYTALAGPIDPPLGPVVPTHKTLSEVEPRIAVNATNTPGDADSLFKITQRGSYYLTGNITGVAAKHGIEIAAGGVTLDLKGFDLVGVAGSLDGIHATGPATDIAVINGSIRNWAQDGVDLGSGFDVVNTRLADLRVSGNSAVGINAGYNAVVTGCAAHLNGSSGIVANAGSLITDCSVRENGGAGISTGLGSTITNCSAYANGSQGINTGSGCTITNCSVSGNAGFGIFTLDGCTIANCSASSNTDDGIFTGISGSITNCSARNNSGDGISASSVNSITNCSVFFNTNKGINVGSDCTIRGNTCANNGTVGVHAGIHASGSDNRIEGNNSTDNDMGITVIGTGNLIIRNSCSGNTTVNYDIGINNRYGPIINITAAGTAAVSGNSAPSTLTSTDATANYAY